MELLLKSKWLGSRVSTGACDVLTINSCHIESVALLSKKNRISHKPTGIDESSCVPKIRLENST